MASITVSIPIELTSCSHKKYNDPAASDLIYRTNAITVYITCNTLLPTVKNYLILTANVINHMDATNNQLGYCWYYRRINHLTDKAKQNLSDNSWKADYIKIENNGCQNQLVVKLNNSAHMKITECQFICAAYRLNHSKDYNILSPYLIKLKNQSSSDEINHHSIPSIPTSFPKG